MKIINADFNRRLSLPGVQEPVRRPVDIDPAQTGFTCLRSLRIYCFEAGSVIDGHAEEDEVFLVVMAGSIELTLSSGEVEAGSPRFVLSAVDALQAAPSVAYLPPGGAYQLSARTYAEIAYARATTVDGRSPAVLAGEPKLYAGGSSLLFEETTYARRLRLHVVKAEAAGEVNLVPIGDDSETEAFLHLRTAPDRGSLSVTGRHGEPTALASWDTLAVGGREEQKLHLASNASALVLVVSASA